MKYLKEARFKMGKGGFRFKVENSQKKIYIKIHLKMASEI